MDNEPDVEKIQTVVIGAGQAGLSVGYHLARRQLPFVILDAHDRVGDVWRQRWDSLRLFTPARYDGLDGMAFPADPREFPSKDAMAAYLEAYASRFNLPVRTATTVQRLSRKGDGYLVETTRGRIEAEHVVVAMASYQAPRVPAFARELRPEILQLHSSAYRAAGGLRPGSVLLVGAGNSGAEIALETARHGHRTWLSGPDTGHIPFRVEGTVGQALLVPLVLRGLFHRVLTVDTPIGRKVRPKVLRKGGPLIRVKLADLRAAGVERVARTTGTENGRPVLADGRVLDAANVIWCTGFHPGFAWIDVPIFDAEGEPRHRSGIATGEPGLYFVGLHFLHAFSSTMIHGVGRDAKRVAGTIEARSRAVAARAPSLASRPQSAAFSRT